MANNQYLTASGECYKPVDTGQKMWWKMLYSEVRVPSAFRLCVDGAEEKNCIQVQGSEGTGIKLMLYEWDVCLSLSLLCVARLLLTYLLER
jgi:hypothetical protein